MSGEKKGIVFKEGNSWYHRVKVLQEDGVVKYSKRGGFTSASEAEKSYKQYEAEFKKAYRDYQLTNKLNMDISFKDYLIFWFEEIYSARIENSTRMVGAYTLYNLLMPYMEQDIKLRYVNVEYLDGLLALAAKTTMSAGDKCRELLSLALKDAVVQGYIKNNPIVGTKSYRRTEPNIVVLNKEKMKAFLAVASQSDWYLEILLALFCGLRKGEIQGLKFSDFDMEKCTVTIERQITANPVIPKGTSKIKDYQVVEKTPKTPNSYRTLNVPKVIIKEVEARKSRVMKCKEKLGDGYCDRDYISCQENGLPHSTSAFNVALSKLCKRNGFPHITVHGLRHMYASILLEQGVPLVKISACLGHSSINTTFEYYCSVIDDEEKIVGFMNAAFVPEEEE